MSDVVKEIVIECEDGDSVKKLYSFYSEMFGNIGGKCTDEENKIQIGPIIFYFATNTKDLFGYHAILSSADFNAAVMQVANEFREGKEEAN